MNYYSVKKLSKRQLFFVPIGSDCILHALSFLKTFTCFTYLLSNQGNGFTTTLECVHNTKGQFVYLDFSIKLSSINLSSTAFFVPLCRFQASAIFCLMVMKRGSVCSR